MEKLAVSTVSHYVATEHNTYQLIGLKEFYFSSNHKNNLTNSKKRGRVLKTFLLHKIPIYYYLLNFQTTSWRPNV